MELSFDKDKIAVNVLSNLGVIDAGDGPFGYITVSVNGDILSIDMQVNGDLPGLPSVNIAEYKLERIC